MQSDPDFGIKYYASYYNKLGDEKLRTLDMIERVFSCYNFFLKMLCHILNRNVALHSLIEPISL